MFVFVELCLSEARRVEQVPVHDAGASEQSDGRGLGEFESDELEYAAFESWISAVYKVKCAI